MSLRASILLPILLILSACSDKVEDVDDTIFREQIRELDKAKALEQQVLDLSKKRQERMDAQVRNGAQP